MGFFLAGQARSVVKFEHLLRLDATQIRHLNFYRRE